MTKEGRQIFIFHLAPNHWGLVTCSDLNMELVVRWVEVVGQDVKMIYFYVFQFKHNIGMSMIHANERVFDL